MHNRIVTTISGAYNANEAEVRKSVEAALAALGPIAQRVNFSIGNDSDGEPAIFFRITLSDEAAKAEKLYQSTSIITSRIFDEVRPLETWGLYPFFTFRSQSEQADLQDPEWM